MEVLKIRQFLNDGNGYGRGYGDGRGNGRGYGNGRGSGRGYGNGRGDGRGYGSGVKSIAGYDVYLIDNVPTIITNIHGNVAKGYVLKKNIMLIPCYIVKGNGYFAHGATLREAQRALEDKIFDNVDVGEKIELFLKTFPDADKKYPAKVFYDWHHKLTGSCEMGRKNFAQSHNIDVDNDTFTVREFIELTETAYGGDVVKMLKEKYEERKKK